MPRESAQREIQMPLDEQEVIAIVDQERSSDLASAEGDEDVVEHPRQHPTKLCSL